MGRYIQAADVSNRFGTDNVKTWSNLDNSTTTLDASRVALAIEYAEDYVDDKFRDTTNYAVPFVGTLAAVPAVVKNWCATMAGVWLYTSRPSAADDASAIPDLQNRIDKEMNLYVSGARKLAAQRKSSGGCEGGSVMTVH